MTAPSITRCPRCRGQAASVRGDIECLACGTIHVPSISIEEALIEVSPPPGRTIVRAAQGSVTRFSPGGAEDGCHLWRTCLTCPLPECILVDPGQDPQRPLVTCAAGNCDRPPFARGYCRRHYDRVRRTGFSELAPRPDKPLCAADGCERPRYARGLCDMHYDSQQRNLRRMAGL